MTDPDAPRPAPPPAHPQAPPPPPPTGLAPPPGYVGYTANPMSSAPLSRVGGLRTALLALLAVVAVGYVVQLLATPGAVDSARDYNAGRIDDDEFLEDIIVFVLGTSLAGLAGLAVIVLSIIWLFRVVRNHRTIGRQLTWGPAWAIGGWFLPPLVLYIIPLLQLRETWKASDPAVAPGDQGWKRGAESPLVWIWWVLYGLVPLVFLVLTFRAQVGFNAGDAEGTADALDDRLGLSIGQAIASLAAAVAWALLVRALTDRHRRLTGEATAR